MASERLALDADSRPVAGGVTDDANEFIKMLRVDPITGELLVQATGAAGTLADVLAAGNTSGANNLIMNAGQKITTNTIDETTAAAGVTIDGVLLKDGLVGAAYGGTGVANNAANTITFTGNFALALTLTAGTSVTLPTTGTLATLAGSEALTNKTINGMTITASTGTFTLTNAKTLSVSDTTTIATNSITFAGGEVVTFTATNSLALITTGATSVTLPTSGTLVSSVITGNGVSAVNTAGALAFTLGAITPTTVNGLTITSTTGTLTMTNGKTLSIVKTMSFTAADDTGVYTLPTGTKTLLATDGAGTSLTGIPYTLTGTANQVVLSAGTGNITFSLPQSIATSSSPSFAALTISASPVNITQTTTSGRATTILRNLASASTDSPIFLVNNQNSGDDQSAGWFETSVASASPVQLVQNTVTSTNFKKYLSLGGNAIWASDGTTPNGNLSGTTGDICINGVGGLSYICVTGTTWTAM